MQAGSTPVHSGQDHLFDLLHRGLPQLRAQEQVAGRLGLPGLQSGEHLHVLDLSDLLLRRILLHVHVLQRPPGQAQALQAQPQVHDLQYHHVLHLLAEGLDGLLPGQTHGLLRPQRPLLLPQETHVLPRGTPFNI